MSISSNISNVANVTSGKLGNEIGSESETKRKWNSRLQNTNIVSLRLVLLHLAIVTIVKATESQHWTSVCQRNRCMEPKTPNENPPGQVVSRVSVSVFCRGANRSFQVSSSIWFSVKLICINWFHQDWYFLNSDPGNVRLWNFSPYIKIHKMNWKISRKYNRTTHQCWIRYIHLWNQPEPIYLFDVASSFIRNSVKNVLFRKSH